MNGPKGGEHGTVPRKTPVGLALAAALAVAIAGCGGGGWRLGGRQTRRDVYLHLMTPLQRAEFLHMEATGKPISLRLAYLQEIGVYQTWDEQPKDIQEAILRREVREGMTPVQVRMAWGPPEERRDVTQPAERAAGHTREVWDYGLAAGGAGGTAYERSVCFYDGRVLWVRRGR